MTTKTATAPVALVDKFHATMLSMGNHMVERSEVIESLTVSMLAELNILLLGKPGTGKSKTVRNLIAHISLLPEGAYYERLLTKFSVPAELFGPPDIPALEHGVYRHVTRGTLVEALIAFIDEIFKGNSAILNSFLAAFNEKIFHNDVPIDMPLSFVVGASNETPKGEELAAIDDRLTQRLMVNPVQGSSAWVQMLKSKGKGAIVPTITWDDILLAQKEVQTVELPNDVYDAMLDLRGKLHRLGVHPTDRRWVDSQSAIQATAWLRGADCADISDLRVLRNVLWTAPSDALIVEKEVLGLASPLEKKALELRSEVGDMQEEFEKIVHDTDNETERHDRAIDLHTKLERALTDVLDLEGQLGAGRRSQVIDDTKAALDTMTDWILRNIFGIDPESRAARRKAS